MNPNISWIARSLARSTNTISSAGSQTIPQINKLMLQTPECAIYGSKYARAYSSLLAKNIDMGAYKTHIPSHFLSPVISKVIVEQPKAGMKLVSNPKRRCKHCYIVIEDERKFVFCDKFPRHKQAALQPGPLMRVSRIMTHATQGGRKTSARMGMWTQQGLREDY
jgi:ribosomal protein L36